VTATQLITVNGAAVTANASSTTICIGESVILTGSGAGSYSWTGGVMDGVAFSPSATTTYTVTGTSGGCTATATQTINVSTVIPTVTANASSTSICNGQSVSLTAGGTAASYSWSSGVADGISFTPSATATYTVTGTLGACTSSATQTITVDAIPVVTASASSTMLCPGEALILSGGGASSYSWSGGAADGVSFIPVSSGTYTVTGTQGACTNTAAVSVTVIVVNAGVSQSGNVLTANSITGGYVWVDCNSSYTAVGGETNQSFTALTDGSYAVIVTESGCADTSSCFLVMGTGIDKGDAQRIMAYPNPSNGEVFIRAAENAVVEIYDAFGQLVLKKEIGSGLETIRLDQQQNGNYMLRVISGDKTEIQRIVLLR
jgi:hypothetical protein